MSAEEQLVFSAAITVLEKMLPTFCGGAELEIQLSILPESDKRSKRVKQRIYKWTSSPSNSLSLSKINKHTHKKKPVAEFYRKKRLSNTDDLRGRLRGRLLDDKEKKKEGLTGESA